MEIHPTPKLRNDVPPTLCGPFKLEHFSSFGSWICLYRQIYNIHLGRRYANAGWPYRRAPAPPEVLRDDSSTSSLVDVDSPHISSVPSDYSGETETQHLRQEREREDAERQAEEAEREAKEKFDEVSQKTGKEYEKAKHTSAEKGKEAKHKAKEVAHDVNEKAKEAGQKAKEVGHDAKVKAKEVGHDAKAKAKEVGRDVNAKANETANDISENRDNPVVIANALIIGLGSIALGYCCTCICGLRLLMCLFRVGAWKKYKAGELDWQVGGFWAGAIGLFALGDYYISQSVQSDDYPLSDLRLLILLIGIFLRINTPASDNGGLGKRLRDEEEALYAGTRFPIHSNPPGLYSMGGAFCICCIFTF